MRLKKTSAFFLTRESTSRFSWKSIETDESSCIAILTNSCVAFKRQFDDRDRADE